MKLRFGRSHSPRLLSMAVLAVVAAAPPCGEARTEELGLVVRVAPTQDSFDPARGVTLRVTVENAAPCTPLLIDPVMHPFRLQSRALLHLRFEIEDSSGKRLDQVNTYGGTIRGSSAQDYKLLDCRQIHGRLVTLGGFDWDYDLAPGRYRVRAVVTSELGTFLSGRPDLRKELEQIHRRSSQQLAELLRDWSITSDEASFIVRD